MPLALALLGAATLVATPAASPHDSSRTVHADARPLVASTHQQFTWRWTDGSKATERTFAQSKYVDPKRIPKFEVTVHPARPSWTARLLFWVNGEWVPRQTKRSDSRGRMRCAFLPIGPDGEWEDVTWIVRIRLRPVYTNRSPVAAPTIKVRELLLTIHYVSR